MPGIWWALKEHLVHKWVKGHKGSFLILPAVPLFWDVAAGTVSKQNSVCTGSAACLNPSPNSREQLGSPASSPAAAFHSAAGRGPRRVETGCTGLQSRTCAWGRPLPGVHIWKTGCGCPALNICRQQPRLVFPPGRARPKPVTAAVTGTACSRGSRAHASSRGRTRERMSLFGAATTQNPSMATFCVIF